jgi:hypothetical protein
VLTTRYESLPVVAEVHERHLETDPLVLGDRAAADG